VIRKFINLGADPATLLSSGKSIVGSYFGKYYYEWKADRTLGEFFCNSIDPLTKVSPDGNTILHELCTNCRNTPSWIKKGLDNLVIAVLNAGASQTLEMIRVKHR
jgi:hypothetical protein